MEVKLDVLMVIVTSTPKGDDIKVALQAPSPFPGEEPLIPPILEMKLKARTGVEWSRKVLGIDPKVILVGG